MYLRGKGTISIISGSSNVRGVSICVCRPTCRPRGSAAGGKATKGVQGADWDLAKVPGQRPWSN